MAINFPNSPSDGQIFYDTTSGNRYIYSSAKGRWSVASNNSPFVATSNNQVLFNNQNSIDGDNGLVFDVGANTLTANTINAYSMRVTGNLYIGSNTVVISNNSISAEMINVTTVMVAGSAIPSGDQSNAMYVVANAAFDYANSTNTFLLSNYPKLDANGSYEYDLSLRGGAYGGTYINFLDNKNTLSNSAQLTMNTGDVLSLYYGIGQSYNMLLRPNGAIHVSTPTLTVGGSNVLASFDSANNYAGAMANSGNAWTQTIVDANLVTARVYTNTSTTAANTYAATVGTSTNNYTSATYSTLTQFGSVFGVANVAFAKANTSLQSGIALFSGTGLDTSGPLNFQRDSTFDDYAIKYDTTKGFFGKAGHGFHFNGSNSCFHIMSSGWTSNFGVDGNGIAIARGSFRAPIFYDQDDTAYYINPNGDSKQAGYTWWSGAGGNLLFDDAAHKRITWNDGGGNFNIRAGAYMNGTLQYIKGTADSNSGATSITMTMDGADASIYLYTAPIGVPGATVSWTGTAYLDRYGTWGVSGDIRTPIYYDSDDTAYYINGAGTSFLNVLGIGTTSYSGRFQVYNSGTVAASFVGGWSNYGKVISLRTDGAGAQDGPMVHFIKQAAKEWGFGIRPYAGDNGLWISEDTTITSSWGTERFRMAPGGSSTFYTDVRSPIFYDSNDTTYYVDPNGTSLLFRLNVNGSSIATNGWTRLVNGMIMQWGITGTIGAGATATVTFPLAFPNAGYFATNIPVSVNLVGQCAPTVVTLGTTTFTFQNQTGITNTFRWFAIGY